MALPIIQKTGAVSGASTGGRGSNDLVAGERVDLADIEGANSGASYLWALEDRPIGSGSVMINAGTPTPHFFVDANPVLAGSHRVRATVDGVDFTIEVFGKPLTNTGARIPSFQELEEYDEGGVLLGWHEALTEFMRTVDSNKLTVSLGNKLIQPIWIGGRESHNDNVSPLGAGAIPFNPSDYSLGNAAVAFTFVIVAANGSTPLTTHAHLFNITDGEIVTSSVIDIVDDTVLTKYSATLTVGAGANEIKTGVEKIYECRIFLDAPPGDPNVDTIELYKAELRVEFTLL